MKQLHQPCQLSRPRLRDRGDDQPSKKNLDELELNTKVKQAAKEDSEAWIDGMLTSASWEEVKCLRSQFKSQLSGREIANRACHFVVANAPSETCAELLVENQRAAR